MIHSLLLMNKFPIHKNLSTSFVNLSALVRHLRSLQFVGSIQIELSSYEAEIEFAENGTLTAREQDLIAGRLSFGEDALRRIMIRAKEAGGLIHVYKSSKDITDPVFVDEAISAGARQMAAGPFEAAICQANLDRRQETLKSPAVNDAPIPKPQGLDGFETTENWTELLALVSELILTVDDALAKGNINFTELFRNACGFVSFDHPFLDPDSDVFSYEGGYISVRQRLAGRDLIAGVTAALERIMVRLREDPFFGAVYHQTMHRIRVLANRRRLQFEITGLGRHLQKITGI